MNNIKNIVKKNTLLVNSSYLILATGFIALFGFVFWVLVARSFDSTTVGLATTLISMSSLLSLLGLAGFDTIFVRFLPKAERKNDQINSGLIISAMASAIVAALFCLAIPILVPKLDFVDHSALFLASFVVVTILSTWNTLTNSILVAFKKTSAILVINIFFSAIKMCLPFVIHRGGPMTIFDFVGIAQITNVALSIAVLMKYFGYKPRLKVHTDIIKQTFRYGSAVYWANIFNLLPDSALPLIVIDKLGASAAAYFYVAFTIANLLYTIAFSTAQVVLAEASSDDESRLLLNLRQGLKVIASLMVPAVVALVIVSPYILGVFGQHYRSGATSLLRIMSISGLAIMLSSSLGVFFKVRGYLKAILVTTASNALVIILLSIVLAKPWGLSGIGWAWLTGSIVSVIVGLFFVNKQPKLLTKSIIGS